MKPRVVWNRSRTSAPRRRRPSIHLMAGRKMKGKEAAANEVAESMSSSLLTSKRYQPRYLQEIVGQNIVVKTLSIAVQKKKIAPLYLFHGPNGTGKTSTARLFAMAFNCNSITNIHNKPCYTCNGCSASLLTMDFCLQKIKTFVQNTLLDPGLKKVFIIDECHLLRLEEWDEVMSLLEGPYGSDVVFLLVTHVDVNTISGNISSRCHKFYFSKLNDDDVAKKLSRIIVNERMVVEEEALKLIVAKAQGSLREAENILDQLALSGPAIDTSAAQQLVGLIPETELMDLVAMAMAGDTINTIRCAKKLSKFVEPASFVSQLTNFIANLLSRDSPPSALLSKTQLGRLCYMLKLLVKTERQLQSATDQTPNLIAAFLDITSMEASTTDIVFPTTQHPSSFSEITAHYSSDEHHARRGSLSDMEQLWKDMLKGIESSHIQKFLHHQAKLASLSISKSNAIIHLSFARAADKMAAEISQETLVKAIEVAIGCPVTLHMILEPLTLTGAGRHPLFSQQQNTNTNRGETSSQGLRLTKSKSFSTSQPQHRRYPSSDTKSPQTTNLIKAEARVSGTQTMGSTSKTRHRWLSLSSIPQSDASVEPYSQDVIYANFNKDGNAPKLHKAFSKTAKDRRFEEHVDQLRSNPAWCC